jgi:hypothetical protein
MMAQEAKSQPAMLQRSRPAVDVPTWSSRRWVSRSVRDIDGSARVANSTLSPTLPTRRVLSHAGPDLARLLSAVTTAPEGPSWRSCRTLQSIQTGPLRRRTRDPLLRSCGSVLKRLPDQHDNLALLVHDLADFSSICRGLAMALY